MTSFRLGIVGDLHTYWDDVDIALTDRAGLARLADMRSGMENGEHRPATVQLCGYSSHRFTSRDVDVTLLSAQPHSMGGPELSFPAHMAATCGVSIYSRDDDVQRRHVALQVDAGGVQATEIHVAQPDG